MSIKKSKSYPLLLLQSSFFFTSKADFSNVKIGSYSLFRILVTFYTLLLLCPLFLLITFLIFFIAWDRLI